MSSFPIEFSNFFEYKRISDSNKWMFQDARIMIDSLYRSTNGDVECVLNNVALLNIIGSKVIGISCFKDQNGNTVFNVPELDQTIEEELTAMDQAGRILRVLYFDNKDKKLFLNNISKFVLYNNKISVEQWDKKNLQNRVNIIFNIILLFLMRKFKK